MAERHNFMGLPLHPLTSDGLIKRLVDHNGVPPICIGYLNAHTVNLALRSGSPLYSYLRRFNIVYADGMSVVKAGRQLHIPVPERVSAADFFLRFCWAASVRKKTIALVGGPPGLVEACTKQLQREVPGLQIVYIHHGYFHEREASWESLCASLAALRPDITLLGMGSPQQEALAIELRDQLRLPAVWCVGALFEYFTPGYRRHAPAWMREAGFEWLYRLAQEPQRLAGRYLVGNLEFLMRVATARWKNRGVTAPRRLRKKRPRQQHPQ